MNGVQCSEWVQLVCFSVRDRDQKTYALSLSYKRVTKHYKIEKSTINGEEKYAIEDGPRFTSLMDVRIQLSSSILPNSIAAAVTVHMSIKIHDNLQQLKLTAHQSCASDLHLASI